MGPRKEDIRAGILTALGATPAATLAAWSESICARIGADARVRGSTSVMGFVPMHREPDIRPLLLETIARGVRVCLPRVDWAKGILEPAEGGDLTGLVAVGRGVLQPPETTPAVGVNRIGTILVPGVAFDTTGLRLGRGGGYYDRFLASLPAPRPFLCGVAFEAQVVDALPAESWDQRVDAIATETRWIIPE